MAVARARRSVGQTVATLAPQQPASSLDADRMGELDACVERAHGRRRRASAPRPGGGRPHRLGDGRRRPRARRRARRAGDGGDRLRRASRTRSSRTTSPPSSSTTTCKDKRSVGVIDEDAERGIQYVAEPIGVVLALTADHQPDLDGALQGDRRRQDPQRDHLPAVGARRPLRAARASRSSSEAGEAAGLPPDALQVDPGRRRSTSPSTSSTTRGVDFIWTTGGPKPSPPPTPPASRASASARATRRSTCTAAPTSPMAVVDILISKTFDASVICPAEQTCVVDDRDLRRDASPSSQRMGARLLDAERGRRARRRSPSTPTAACSMEALGQLVPRPRRAGRLRRAGRRRRSCSRRCPSDLDELAAHPLVQEKLMPVLGLVRSPSRRARDRRLRARHRARRARPHVGRLRPRRRRRRRASPSAIRTGRILVNAPTAVGALGGVYNAMTPTFSLGCGTWGGSTTTDNVNYRNLLNIKTVSRRQTPPQWFRVPSDTYFNAGRARQPARRCAPSRSLIVTDARHARRAASSTRCAPPRRAAACTCSPTSSRSRPRPQIRAGVERARPDRGPT